MILFYLSTPDQLLSVLAKKGDTIEVTKKQIPITLAD